MSRFGRFESWPHSVGPVHLNLKCCWPVNPIVREPQSPGPVEGGYAGSRSVWGIVPLLWSRPVTQSLCLIVSVNEKGRTTTCEYPGKRRGEMRKCFTEAKWDL